MLRHPVASVPSPIFGRDKLDSVSGLGVFELLFIPDTGEILVVSYECSTFFVKPNMYIFYQRQSERIVH